MQHGQTELWRMTLGINHRAAVASNRRLLYKVLLEDARHHFVSGGTVVQSIGGSLLGRQLSDVRNEIGSNELPLSITFVDAPHSLLSWLPRACLMLQGKGIIAVEELDTTQSVEFRGFSEGVRLEVFTMESARSNGTPLYQLVAEQLRKDGAPWVSVSRALCGFGAARSVHRGGWLRRRADSPIVVTALFPKELSQEVTGQVRNLLSGSGYLVMSPVQWSLP